MALEQTCAIIKPGAVKAQHTGAIIELIERNGFQIVRMEKRALSRELAERFYHVHRERSFFSELVDDMTGGPVIAMILEKESAIADWRQLMGATNPAQATVGTLRRMFGTSIGHNATHGSDAAETFAHEKATLFPE